MSPEPKLPPLPSRVNLRGYKKERRAVRFHNPLRQWQVQVSWRRIQRAANCRWARKSLAEPDIGPFKWGLIGLIK